MTDNRKFKLVTRSDFDGLVCALLLKEMDILDDIQFVHPKDMQDGKVSIDDSVITTNLPYVSSCHMAFDHHRSEMIRRGKECPDNHVIDPDAPSAARVVYDYYGGKDVFEHVNLDLLEAVDKGDSAQFSREEILNPGGWVLLNFLMDARTGLGRFRNFRISNYELMMELIDYCREHDVDQILALPDVAERVEVYNKHAPKAKEQIERCSTVYGNLVVLDLRNEETIWATNRFMIYALFPQCNISIHVMWGLKKRNTVFAIGNSIIDRGSKTDIGELCLLYRGGGHRNAGTCQVDNDDVEPALNDLIDRISENEA